MRGNRHPITEHLKPYHFQKGKSGNANGRSPHLVYEIKKLTSNGIEMAHVMVKIMRGQKIPGVIGNPTYKDVRESCMWLAERVFGKSPISFKLPEDGEMDLLKAIYMEWQKLPGDQGRFELKNDHIIDVNPIEKNGTNTDPKDSK